MFMDCGLPPRAGAPHANQPRDLAMAYLIFQMGDHKEAIPIINEDKGFQIGRHPESDLAIQEDTSTSRRHCIIRRASRQEPFVLDDLGSSNGTYVNGERVWATSAVLHDGDTLLIGAAEFVFQVDQQDYELTSTTSIIVKPDSPPPSAAATPKPAEEEGVEPSVMDTVQLDRNRDLPNLSRPLRKVEQEGPLVLSAGTEVNGFEIIRLLGTGQYASVYLANQVALRRTVALKAYPLEGAHAEGAAERFIASVQGAGRIQHPNVLSCIDTGFMGQVCYYTMPYHAEGSLAQRLAERGPLAEAEAREMMVRLAYAIEHVQGKYRLIHYNLKPGNILIADHGEPVIADYGLAEWASTCLQVNRKSFFGNPAYMCAEQVLDRGPDWTCDMYALGVVFFEMLYGRPPFEADTPYRMIEKHLNEPVGFPAQPPVAEGIRATIRRMLAKKPEDRFSNWQALIRELEVRKVAGGGGKAPAPTGTPAAPARQELTKSQMKITKMVRSPAKNIKLPATAKKPGIVLKKVVR